MSDKIRLRYGDTNPVCPAVDSATVIEIGDLVYQDINNAKPASMLKASLGGEEGLGGTLSPEQLQQGFAEVFLGVAMQRSRSGDTNSVRVATTGVFEFDCPSGTFELGDLVGVAEAASGTALEDQKVASISASIYAVGRVAKRVATAATTVLIDIRSTVMTGGTEGSSPSGV